MKLLLDTDALIWWGQSAPRLPEPVRALIADRANVALFSIVSLWELVIKAMKRGTPIDIAEIDRRMGAAGVQRLAVNLSHLVTLRGLPSPHHDPFDRIIIAQALAEGATIVSSDQAFPLYDVPLILL